MNENDRERPSESKLPDDEEPILLTEEVPSSDQDEEPILLTEEVPSSDQDEEPILLSEELLSSDQDEEALIDLDDLDGDDLTADGDTKEDGIGIALGYSLTPEKIDRALERTIEKLYGQRIESLLVEIVQKKVSAEIEKIKKSLLDD